MARFFPYVLSVVAKGNEAAEPAGAIRAAVAATGTADEIRWLSPFHAFDIPFLDRPDETLAAARAVAPEIPLDINVVAAEHRKKKVLIADMDSTMVGCECIDELADMAGLKPLIAPITERTMRGEIGFEGALRERVALLKGLDLDALRRTYEERVKLNPGARAAVMTMRAHGAYTLLVSGGFTYFTARVAKAAGFQEEQANVLMDDGVALTGQVRDPILGREAKLSALERTLARLKLAPSDALAVGDGANDLDMIGKAGLGVAYHAKPVVAAAAGARIDHGDLTALLYLQGYRDEEIVTG